MIVSGIAEESHMFETEFSKLLLHKIAEARVSKKMDLNSHNFAVSIHWDAAPRFPIPRAHCRLVTSGLLVAVWDSYDWTYVGIETPGQCPPQRCMCKRVVHAYTRAAFKHIAGGASTF